MFTEYFIANPQTVGGFGHTVEIDECLLVRRKYNVGHVIQQWVFGGMNLITNEVFGIPAENRTPDTSLPLIPRFIRLGTVVASELWRADGAMGNLPQGYLHLIASHSQLVDLATDESRLCQKDILSVHGLKSAKTIF